MGIPYKINDTRSYHVSGISTLGWELTVCNALEETGSPCRDILLKKDTFGNLLYDYLSSVISMDSISSMLEIGGGYGFLMRDFLGKNPAMKAHMVEISGLLLRKQRETLRGFDVEFMQNDFFDIDTGLLFNIDLAVLNEVIGDFVTVCEVSPEIFNTPDAGPDPVLRNIKRIYLEYGLPLPGGVVTVNLGALNAVERLCMSGIKYIYISEHSCEAAVPDELKDRIRIASPGEPEQIRLMGHDEYTIKFSYLEKIAKKLQYRVVRGQYRDIMPFEYSDRLNFILTSHSQKDEHEIIRQFAEDLFKYEYLIMSRGDLKTFKGGNR